MNKRITLITAMALCWSGLLAANEYSYKDHRYEMAFKDGVVSMTYCEKKECSSVEGEVAPLKEKLSAAIEQYRGWLADVDKLTEETKKQISEAGPDKKIHDPGSKKDYIMISFGNNFNLPLDVDMIKKEDFSLVTLAITSAVEDYERAAAILEAGEAPPSIKAENKLELFGVKSLYDTLRFSSYL